MTQPRIQFFGEIPYYKASLINKKPYFNVRREGFGRRASGAQAALSVTHELTRKLSLIGEVSGQLEEDVLPRGLYPLRAHHQGQ